MIRFTALWVTVTHMGSGRWIAILLSTVAAACGGHSVRENPGGAAGSTSTVHPTPTDPTPSDNPGPGDNPTPSDDPEPDDPLPTDPIAQPPKPLPVPCEYESLDIICASGSCPQSPDDFGDLCAKGLVVGRTSTTCGGSVVVIGYSFGQTSWYFDASGALTGSISVGDVEEQCADGHRTNARVYGSVCQTSGILLDVCPTSDTCGAPHMCVPGPDCPLHAGDVLSSYCSDPTTEVVRAWDTTCGGHMLTVTRTTDEVRYCYDAQDRLTGVATLQISDNSWSLLGTDCRATNQSSLPCVPK